MQGGLVKVHPEAIEEARVAREWYHARSSEVAEAFMAEVDLAVKRIVEAPHQWPPYLAGTRRYLLHSFPFWIVFRETEGFVQVLAVAHARRRPGYWRGR